MADILDVENELATLVQNAVYPNGTGSASVAGCDIRIYPGWPIPDTLDADLTARKAHVSIFPSNVARTTTRFNTEWDAVIQNDPTLVLTVNLSAGTITVSGTVSIPQATMAIVNRVAYSYGVLITDTINSIATNLAALIPNASAVGAVITIANAYTIETTVIVSGTSTRELAREKRLMLLTVWAPTPLIRSQIANAIASSLAGTYRIAMPDGYYAQLSYNGSNEQDILEKVKCFRRDIHFIVEYAITQSETDYTIGENTFTVTPLLIPPNPPFV